MNKVIRKDQCDLIESGQSAASPDSFHCNLLAVNRYLDNCASAYSRRVEIESSQVVVSFHYLLAQQLIQVKHDCFTQPVAFFRKNTRRRIRYLNFGMHLQAIGISYHNLRDSELCFVRCLEFYLGRGHVEDFSSTIVNRY